MFAANKCVYSRNELLFAIKIKLNWILVQLAQLSHD